MPGYDNPADHDATIDTVIANVLDYFRKRASTQEVLDLERGRPSIPREVDKALLIDLSDAIGVYDISDALRYRLRDRFWEVYDSQK